MHELVQSPVMKVNRSIPVPTVIPVLSYPDVGEAVAWLAAASTTRSLWTFSETLADVAPEEWGGTTVE
jgi:hypothetical protein